MICFFDTETTGLPKDWKAPMGQVENWPRVIELAWTITDLKGEILNVKEVLIKPDGWTIPVEQFWIDHGFNTEKSLAEGTPITDVLGQFLADLATCEFLVSHNMDFDHKVLGAEMLRAGVSGKRTVRICTKEASTDYCEIPFEGQRAYMSKKMRRFKWPKLTELHVKLFGREFDNAHQAGGDVIALKNCFFELVKRKVIQYDGIE